MKYSASPPALIEYDLHRLRPGQRRVERLRRQRREVGAAGHGRQRVGRVGGVRDLAGALGHLERVRPGVDVGGHVVPAGGQRRQRHQRQRADRSDGLHHGTSAKQ
jgi:hypothetical protein